MILKNFLWDYSGRLTTMIASLVITGVLSRILSPADYGLMGLVLAVSGIASMFLDLGFGSAIVQQKTISDKQLSTIFYLNWAVGIVIYILIFFGSSKIGNFYQTEELSFILKISALAFIISPINLVPMALIHRRMLFKEQAVRNIVVTLFIGVIAIYMAYNGFGVWSLVFQSLVGTLLSLVINLQITRWRPIFYFKLKSISEIFQYSSFLFLSSLLNKAYSKIDIFIIGKVLSLATLGQYSRALGFEGIIRGISSSSILSVLFPYFSKIQDDDSLIIKQWEKSFSLICFFFFLVMGGSFISSKLLFLLLFGEQWLIASDYFKIIILAGFTYPLSSLALSIMEACGNTKDFFKVEVLKKIIVFPCFIIAYYYGIKPFLISLLVAYQFGFLLNLIFLKRTINYKLMVQLKELGQYIAIVAVFILAGSFWNYERLLDSTSIVAVLTINVIFSLYYLTSIYILRQATLQLAYKLFLSLLSRK